MPRPKKVPAPVETTTGVDDFTPPTSEELRQLAAQNEKPIKTMVVPERATISIYRDKVVVVEGRQEITVSFDT